MSNETYRLSEARAAVRMWKDGRYPSRRLFQALAALECDVDFRDSDTGPYLYVQDRKTGDYFEMHY